MDKWVCMLVGRLLDRCWLLGGLERRLGLGRYMYVGR